MRLNRRTRYNELILDILGVVPRNPQFKHFAFAGRKSIARGNGIDAIFEALLEHVPNPSIRIPVSLDNSIARANLKSPFSPGRFFLNRRALPCDSPQFVFRGTREKERRISIAEKETGRHDKCNNGTYQKLQGTHAEYERRPLAQGNADMNGEPARRKHRQSRHIARSNRLGKQHPRQNLKEHHAASDKRLKRNRSNLLTNRRKHKHRGKRDERNPVKHSQIQARSRNEQRIQKHDCRRYDDGGDQHARARKFSARMYRIHAKATVHKGDYRKAN